MDYTKCDACGREFLRDQLTAMDGKLLCPECAALEPEEEAVEPADAAEAGEESGSDSVARRGMPAWAWAILLIVVALAAYGAFHGVRVMRANACLKQAKALFFTENNISGALAAVRQARELLPGDREIIAYGNYYAGVAALYREENEQAVASFAAVDIPLDEQEWSLNSLRNQSAMNLAFDQKKYDVSLALALKMLENSPDDPMLLFQVASASAACYAQLGNEDFRKISQECLKKVGASMADAPDAAKARMDYETRRIRHRLETRQILTRREYERQFGAPGEAPTTATQSGGGQP